MIGAANSPMNMFNAGGGDAFQRGMVIGNANSPFSSVAEALKNTVDRYHQHLDTQQEQQNKIDLFNQEMQLKRQNALPDPDAAGPFTQLDPKTNKSFVRSTTIDPTTGQQKVSWQPVTINAPEDPKKQFEGAYYKKMNDAMSAAGMGGNIPNVIQQRANGAVASATGQQTSPLDVNQSAVPTYNPATQKLQQNAKTGEYRVVPR